MVPKDKDKKIQKSGVIYWFKCPHINCQEEYIGESARSLGDSLKEHLRAPSPIHHHSHTTGHPVSEECFTTVGRESQGITRAIKEAMYAQVNDLFLNRNLGKFQLLTYGMRYFRTLHHYSSSNSTLPPSISHNIQGAHNLNLVSMVQCGVSFPPPQHSPFFPTPHLSGAIFGN